MFDLRALTEGVRDHHVAGPHCRHRVTVGSTMDVARDASPTDGGLIVVADGQTAGRGRRGATWVAASGAGLWLSLRAPGPPLAAADAVAWATTALVRAVRRTTGLRPTIKWPNDLLLDGRKLAGILVENRRSTVIGFGVNVLPPSDPTLAAASLDGAVGRSELAVALAAELEATARLATAVVVDRDRVIDDWRRFAEVRSDQEVAFRTIGGSRGKGRLARCDPRDGLLLADARSIPAERLDALRPAD